MGLSARARPTGRSCVSSPITVSGGPPAKPSASTFQPACFSTTYPRVVSAVTLAIVAPDVKPTLALDWSPRSSASHEPATSSAKAGSGRHRVEDRVLVPGAREPIRRKRGRQRSADNESEVAWARLRDEARVRCARQPIDHMELVHRTAPLRIAIADQDSTGTEHASPDRWPSRQTADSSRPPEPPEPYGPERHSDRGVRPIRR